MVLSAAPQHVAIHDVPPRRALRHFHTWLETVGTRLEFSTGEPIRLKNERDSTLCSLERGAARLRKPGCFPSPQILDFLVPGELFILPTPDSDIMFEALTSDTMIVRRRDVVLNQSPSSGTVGKLAHDALMISPANRFQRQILILGRPTASGRCLAFLLDMAKRLNCCRGTAVVLPICLSDLSAYLAIKPSELAELLRQLVILRAVDFVDRTAVAIIDPVALRRAAHQDLPVGET